MRGLWIDSRAVAPISWQGSARCWSGKLQIAGDLWKRALMAFMIFHDMALYGFTRLEVAGEYFILNSSEKWLDPAALRNS